MVEKTRELEKWLLPLWFAATLVFGWLHAGPWAWSALALSFWAAGWTALAGTRAPAHPVKLWLLWIIAALPLAAEPLAALKPTAQYALCAGLYFAVAARGAQERADIVRIAHIAAYAAALLFIALHVLNIPTGPVFAGVYYNALAGFAAAGAAGSLAMACAPANRGWKKTAFAALAALSLAAVLLSRSRGALLGALAGMLLALALHRRWRALVMTAAALSLAVLLTPRGMLLDMAQKGDPLAFGRLHIWRVALDAIAAHPLAGCGAGGFANAYSLFEQAYRTGIALYGHYALEAHSVLLNLAAENGIPAALLFLLLALRLPKRGFENAEAIRPLAMAGALFTQGVFDGVFCAAPLALLFFALCGAAEKEPGIIPPGRADHWFPACGLALCVAACGALFFHAAPDWSARAQAALARTPPNPYRALDALDRAVQATPSSAPLRLDRGLLLARLGLDRQAGEDFSSAAALEPAFVAPVQELAALSRRHGAGAQTIALEREAAARLELCALAPRGGYQAFLCQNTAPAAEQKPKKQRARRQ